MKLLLRSLAVIALIALVGIGLDTFVSEHGAVWWLGIAFVAAAIMQTVYLVRLYHWSSLPRNRALPAGIGPWRPIIARLARFVRQETDARTELVSELERIHAAVDRLPDGLVVLDRYDHVLWANDAAEALHGIFGTRRPIHHFIRQPEFARFIQANEPDSTLRIQLPAYPGHTYELRLPRTPGDQKLLITRDITDQAKLDAMRSDFVANVSHEIRTPITVIAGFAETLLTLEIDEAARREYLGSILKQSQTMQRLVEDLLMLSSLESDGSTLEDEPLEVQPLLESLLEEARLLSQGRHHFALRLEGPRRIVAAPGELESAVRNLLTNAIRYTPEGGRIGIEWRVQDSEGRITVRDTGIGIAAEHIPRLTERFYRVDRGRSRANGGTGLGLAIIKRIMHRHQGRLQFETAPGKGSAFTLCLPAARLVPDPVPVPVPAPAPAGTAQAGTDPASTAQRA
ncbi:MAG: phosphate regulon sensor histidine kinase PhoR [Burkholderiales bacterium]|nr:phosphate regulon sensor histidine kinase PhoR [Burkholderiales bacterium]OJX04965.1 MAG: phosphate regulon sensor histidine kinase PhoR [Burkholderiales bacterium 70-64]